jgi:hypothetical protein
MFTFIYPALMLFSLLALTALFGWHGYSIFMWAWLLIHLTVNLAGAESDRPLTDKTGPSWDDSILTFASMWLGTYLCMPYINVNYENSFLGSILNWSGFILLYIYGIAAVILIPSAIYWIVDRLDITKGMADDFIVFMIKTFRLEFLTRNSEKDFKEIKYKD